MSDIQCRLHRNSLVAQASPDHKTFALRRLEKSFNQAREKADRAKQITDSICTHQQEILELIQEIEKRKAFLQVANTNAVKIQKLFRGFLVRSRYDDEILKIRRKTIAGWISELYKSDQHNLTFTGKKPEWAGRVLTKFARRLLFLFKIKRIAKAYEHYKMLKEAEGLVFIRKALQIFYNKNLLSLEKFYIYRKARLAELHINLALLTIKNFYRANCLSFSAIMKRIKKFKRMLKMCKSSSMQSKGDIYSTRDQSTTRSEVFGAESNADLKGDDLGNILECASLTSTEYLEIEKVRKDKIMFGMIAYNIPRGKEPVAVLPYLYQKDIIEEHFPSKNYQVLTNCLISRMTTIQPVRHSPKKPPPKKQVIELPSIFTPNSPKKLHFDNENLPNFTRPTASSLASRHPDPDSTSPKNFGTIRDNTTLFNQTFCGLQKLADIKRRSISSHKKTGSKEMRMSLPTEWSPTGSVQEKFKNYRAQTTFDNSRK